MIIIIIIVASSLTLWELQIV